MLHHILPLIPKHTVYVEPFAGSATVLFGKPFPKVTNIHHYREVINDTNKLVYTFFKVLQDKPDELIQKLTSMCYSQVKHQEAINICKNNEAYDNMTVAIAFWYNINTSFAKSLSAGFSRSVYGSNDSYGYYTRIKNLNNYLNRMQSVTVDNLDALICIDRWDSPQTCFYCDPPYPNTDQGHYKGWTMQNQIALVERLKTAKGSVVLSGYNCGLDMTGFAEYKFNMVSSAKNGKDRTAKNIKRLEVVWVKPSETPRAEILKLYESGQFDCFASLSFKTN